MKITITLELDMTDKNLRAWANEYGLSMSEVASDATGHIGELVRSYVENISQVKDFTTIKHYTVK